jgi:uncharacterized membrane protein|nr:MAG TPA: hypothetical protein [Caudoviricetes sp.]
MRKGLVIVIGLIVGYAISWAITVGIIKLITMCFSIGFSLPIATGIWLILCLLNLVFHKLEGRR